VSNWDYFADEKEYDTGPTFGAPPSYGDQPGYGEPGPMPPTYRSLGIIALICAALFNLLLGFPTAWIARRYSSQVLPLWEHGDRLAALSASRKARAWLIASFVMDVLGIVVLVLALQGARSDFNNPSVVAASIKTQVQQRISDSSGPYYLPGATVTSVSCTHAGTNTDQCVIRYSTGETDTVTATISGNGTRYVTK
jgi:hypothetical protein